MQMAEYTNLERLYTGQYTTVYRGTRASDGAVVIIKQLNGPHPPADRVAKLEREYEIAVAVAGDGVVEPLGMSELEGLPAIVFRDTAGRSVRRWQEQGRIALLDAVTIGACVARALSRIHELGVIHKDINPANVVWSAEQQQVQVIDFGISTRLPRETPALASPSRLEGTLAYIAPEQTGRMNRRVDYRTDLYALGATLYELLCGRPPFEADDSLALVHAHIALEPTPPYKVHAAVPLVLSDIAMKLLSKGAEERYQSAAGVAVDLERCAAALAATGRVEPFELASADASHQLRIPDKLYGRESEVDALFQAYAKVAAGAVELVLVSGYSGIGKTALVREVHRPMTADGGHFVAGKFEQYNRGTPYASLLQAVGAFISRLLAETDDTITLWRDRLLAGLGADSRVLTDVLPELELILGEQPAVPELPSAEAANRFQIVFRRFIRALADEDHPLVLFFDDLQWADTPTLTLLEGIAADDEARHLLVLGAYRDNEVDALHPLAIALDRIKESGRRIRRIQLQNLEPDDVQAIVVDTLRSDEAQVAPLASLCYQKTRGNPFFLTQFIEMLYRDDLLRFDTGKGWAWDIPEIERKQITDNVVDFMGDRVTRMGADTCAALSHAAFLGTDFDLAAVSQLSGVDAAVVREHLADPLSEDMIVATHEVAGRYQFAHDRVQQAAYALTDEGARPALHLAVGRLLLERHDAQSDESAGVSVFDVVNQLNAGAELMTDSAERGRAASLNHRAGRRALNAAAYEPANTYLSAALQQLAADSWTADYASTLAVHLDAARAAYLSVHSDRLEVLVNAVLEKAVSELDKVAAHEVALDASYAAGELNGTLDRGLDVLRLLGIDIPNQPGEPEVVAGLTATQAAMEGKDLAAIMALPDAEDPAAAAVAAILHKLASPAYFARPMLLPIVAFELVQAAVRDGISTESQFGFVVRALFLCLIGDIGGGIESGKIATALGERSDAPQVVNVTKHVYTTHVRLWTSDWADVREPLREVFRDGHDLGDFLYACFGAHMVGAFGMFGGAELGGLLEETNAHLDRMITLQQGIPERLQRMNVQLIHNLRHGPADATELSGEYWDAAQMVPQLTTDGDASNLYVHFTSKLAQLLVLGDYEGAAKAGDENQAWLAGAASSIFVPNYTYLDALAQLQVLESLEGERHEAALARIDGAIGAHTGWAAFGPMHTHRITLLTAERTRVLGGDQSPHDLYPRACAEAEASGILYDQALANELAGRYYLRNGNKAAARGYLGEARHLYERWGSGAKLAQMETAYGGLLQTTRAAVGATVSPTVTSATGSLEVDSLAIIRSSRAISREIKLSKLVEVLLSTSIESTGARKGLLILADGDDLVVEAEGHSDAGVTVTNVGTALEKYAACPQSILRYVQRTSEAVLLADAAAEGNFQEDPHITAHGVRSVLCVPLEQQGKLNAILYLENE